MIIVCQSQLLLLSNSVNGFGKICIIRTISFSYSKLCRNSILIRNDRAVVVLALKELVVSSLSVISNTFYEFAIGCVNYVYAHFCKSSHIQLYYNGKSLS